MVLIQGAGLFIVIYLFGDDFILNKKPSGMLLNTYIIQNLRLAEAFMTRQKHLGRSQI